MNENKISFIICSNREEELAECLVYLDNLVIPEGMEMEVIVVNRAESLAGAYNLAMKESDAKYKVYIHQDVYIINPTFIGDIIRIFCAEPSIGIIGTLGTGKMPSSGCWFESRKQLGTLVGIYSGEMQLRRTEDFEEEYRGADVVDGIVIATQYDIEWREDLFDGWHFYDSSCCYEFRRRGYKVVVPRQDQPWSIHRCARNGLEKEYEKYRQIFVKEYLEN